MGYDYKSYIGNNAMHAIVDRMIEFDGTQMSTQDGRRWKVEGKPPKGKAFEETHIIDNAEANLARRILNAVGLFFKYFFSSTFRKKFNHAITKINEACPKVAKQAEKTVDVAKPVLNPKGSKSKEIEREIDPEKGLEEISPPPPVATVKTSEAEAPLEVKKGEFIEFDEVPTSEKLGTTLIRTNYPNVDKIVVEIQQKTGSYRLANVWGRLLGKISHNYHRDIVESFHFDSGRINVKFVKIHQVKDSLQYRMWVPTSKNEEGVVEPLGGVIMTLSSEIVLTPKQGKNLKIVHGLENFIELPGWAKLISMGFKKFGGGATTLMQEDNENIIMTVGPTHVVRSTPHEKLDRNWRIKGIVLDGKVSSQDCLLEHKKNNDFLADD